MNKYDLEPVEFYIQSVDTMDDGNRLFDLIPIKEQRTCPLCGGTGVKHGSPSARQVRDLSVSLAQVGLRIHVNRYKCKECDNTWTDTFESIDSGSKITNRMRDYIRNRSLMQPFKTLADELGISDTTVKRVFNDYIVELDMERKLYSPKVLGIDENHLVNNYRAVFVDVEQRKLLDILPKRSKVAVKGFIKALPDYQNIEVVTMDMWKPYRDAVKDVLPEAVVVVDKFHVIKEVNGALERIRKSFNKTVDKSARKYLKNSRFLLLTAKENLGKAKEKQRDELFRYFPALERPYYIKELLRQLYVQETREDAEKWFDNIRDIIYDYDELQEFKEVLDTIENWHEEIFNYFDYQYTNAATENINKMINDIGSGGHGYSFEILRYKAIYQEKIKKSNRFEFPK